ncbi:aminodeoxychorismate synthase component I [Nitratireductor aquimarinus]|uniref:aminodeoxychorismate synthase component I n=1 Tax=Nitratireductor aquimarinus TaxID=889300 RepID=UPI001A8CB48C|nr:aminodeoxychorismate synthase component I [Nitratireductor aquimarinus]MBN8244005.1 aminodeoxychorismate synthase component I [Nitratireductor aquimarinus]MBY6131539.1 aminodeoxychorismate synthase component I [Nitratireductor aquimarinus]MCA1301075.1 aminodeoxychorismate synthase component I [Nitratireductor aquimarinus]
MLTDLRGQALFRDDMAGRELFFSRPRDVLIAWDGPSFDDMLARAEKARSDGFWLAGYMAYEAGYLLEPKLKPLLPEGLQQAGRRGPLLCFGVFDAPEERAVRPVLDVRDAALGDAQPLWTFEDYAPRFERLHAHLRAGDCYQANLTFPVHARWEGEPAALFDALGARQPVRYAALLDLGWPVIVSRSPELFFQVSRDGWIETMPMKGTAPRGETPDEDAALKDFLRNDPKNQAENRMIVDLLRNDISRISEVGTLDVPELFHVETYQTVHQMVSRVRARLTPGTGLREIFSALFPCGSVTGAPKIRAMEILHALEAGPRGAYCGSVGWVAPDGTMRFNVAIRTVSLFEDGSAIYNVGGGVVFDSTARGEYEEALVKARFAKIEN